MVLIPIDPPPAYLQRTPSTGGFGSSPSRHSSRPSLPPAHSGFSMASRIKTTSSVVPSARRTAGPRFSTEEFDTQLDAIEAQRREEFERVKMKRPKSKGATTRVIGRGASVALLAAKKKLRDASAKSLPASHPQSTSFDGDTDDEGEALRLEPACAAALSLYWRTAKAADGARTAGDRGVTFVRKASYILLSVKLAKALRDDFRAKDAVAVAEEEWREYAGRGREAIGQKAFEEAILAVAEVHNGSTGAAECAEFLTELWGRVAHADDAGVCHWREDDEIGYWPRERASLVARRRRTSDLEDAELPTLTEDGGDVPWSPVDTRRSSRQWTPPGQPSLAPSSSLPDLSRRREDLGMPPLPDLTIESLDLARIEAEAEAEAAAEAAAAAAAAPPVVVEPPIDQTAAATPIAAAAIGATILAGSIQQGLASWKATASVLGGRPPLDLLGVAHRALSPQPGLPLHWRVRRARAVRLGPSTILGLALPHQPIGRRPLGLRHSTARWLPRWQPQPRPRRREWRTRRPSRPSAGRGDRVQSRARRGDRRRYPLLPRQRRPDAPGAFRLPAWCSVAAVGLGGRPARSRTRCGVTVGT